MYTDAVVDVEAFVLPSARQPSSVILASDKPRTGSASICNLSGRDSEMTLRE